MTLTHTQAEHRQHGTAADQPDEQRIADLRLLDRRIAETSKLLRQLRDEHELVLKNASAATQAAWMASRVMSNDPPVDIVCVPDDAQFTAVDDLSQESCPLSLDQQIEREHASIALHRNRIANLESLADLRRQRHRNALRRISPAEQGEMQTMQAAHESHQRRLAEDATEPGRDYME